MTPAQARQALLPYVVAPDTTLTATPVTTMDGFGGGAWYLFYGDSNGGRASSYQIDATTGQKTISYYGATTWDLQANDAPPFLPSNQLAQSARNFAAAHFPGYIAGMPEDDNGGRDPVINDADGFWVDFNATAPSGAELPVWCGVGVEEDTGNVDDYMEKYIPVTIDTNPAMTPDQAQAAAQTWIAQNISADPDQTALVTTYTPPIRLKVEIDPMLNQELAYEVACRATMVLVDAQTGSVVGTEDWAGMSLPGHKGPQKGPTLPKKRRETLWPVFAHPGVGYDGTLVRSAIQTNGAVYLWAGYLKALGIQSSNNGRQVQLKRRNQRLKLSIRNQPRGSTRFAWKRKGSLYLPVDALESLNGELRTDATGQDVTLNDPRAPAARTSTSTRRPEASSGSNKAGR